MHYPDKIIVILKLINIHNDNFVLMYYLVLYKHRFRLATFHCKWVIKQRTSFKSVFYVKCSMLEVKFYTIRETFLVDRSISLDYLVNYALSMSDSSYGRWLVMIMAEKSTSDRHYD